ncbi:hypothetical protein D9758_017059 [Tetrapyrgos nigripes]|uniref:Uncharacterized protein n=1 Tax=Tetrapyrgos nigripes TaxID=182062 RepID=A0A8H5CGF7_9AGAR|nr:hypothetical protein D9758_017059 [Tetrapyrgos nigripes]
MDEFYYSFVLIYLSSTFCTLLYGTYVILFGLCIYIMRHKRGEIRKMHQITMTALFTIATLGFILNCVESSANVGRSESLLSQKSVSANDPHLVLFGISLLSVNGLYVLAKCYKIWGCKKKVIIFPVLISVVNNGFGIVRIVAEAVEAKVLVSNSLELDLSDRNTVKNLETLGNFTRKFFTAVNLFTNLFIPMMIAGRIWWIGHQAAKFMGTKKLSLTSRTLAVCLESAILYPLFLVPGIVFYTALDNLPGDFIPILIQIVGIAPTFIIVRVALGISIENVQHTVAQNKNLGQQAAESDSDLMTILEENRTYEAKLFTKLKRNDHKD